MRVRNLHAPLAGLVIWLMAGAGSAAACEINPARITFFGKLFSPGSQFFYLQTGDVEEHELTVTVSRRQFKARATWVKTPKRIRNIRGEQLRVENSRIVTGESSGLSFQSEDGAFAGSLYEAEGTEHRIWHWTLRVSDMDGQSVRAKLEYDTPRPLYDALNDAVCAYQALPRALKGESGNAGLLTNW